MSFCVESQSFISDFDTESEVDRPKTCRSYELRRYKADIGTFSFRHQPNTGIIRYINPAVFIQKTEVVDASDEHVEEVVPPLDLNTSGETLPSERVVYEKLSIPKTFEVSKIIESNAFSNWLSAKKKLKSYECAKNKEIREQQKRLIEEKKSLAKKKYQEWLNKKLQTPAKPPQQKIEQFQEYQPQKDDSEANRRAWEHSKLEEQRRRREEQIKVEQKKKVLEERRKKQADKAWNEWLEEAPYKPKPVPLNQGFLTLKGTISGIFVNPNPWRDPCAEDLTIEIGSRRE